MKNIAVCIALVCSAGFGYYCVDGSGGPGGPGSYQEVVRQRDSAEQTLRDQGAALERRNFGIADAWVVDLSNTAISSETLEALAHLGVVAELNFSGTAMGDEELKRLGELKIGGYLVRVNLNNTNVSDSGLDGLTNSLYLRELNLEGTKVTDAGMRQWQAKRSANPHVPEGFRNVKVTR